MIVNFNGTGNQDIHFYHDSALQVITTVPIQANSQNMNPQSQRYVGDLSVPHGNETLCPTDCLINKYTYQVFLLLVNGLQSCTTPFLPFKVTFIIYG